MKDIIADNGMLIVPTTKIEVNVLLSPRWECPRCGAVNIGVSKETVDCYKCSASFPKAALKPDGRTLSLVRKILSTYRPNYSGGLIL